MNEINEKTQKMIEEIEKRRNNLAGPLVGDYVKYPDGTYKRFSHAWDDGIQVTCYYGNGGSFFLCSNGKASYSGGLDPSIPYPKLKITEEIKEGLFWVFKDDVHMAFNGVHFNMDCKVWELA